MSFFVLYPESATITPEFVSKKEIEVPIFGSNNPLDFLALEEEELENQSNNNDQDEFEAQMDNDDDEIEILHEKVKSKPRLHFNKKMKGRPKKIQRQLIGLSKVPRNTTFKNCPLCSIKFSNSHALSSHIASVHQKQGTHYTCLRCGMTFGRRDYFMVHKSCHSDYPEELGKYFLFYSKLSCVLCFIWIFFRNITFESKTTSFCCSSYFSNSKNTNTSTSNKTSCSKRRRGH
jgi:hypothetical protein